MESILCVDIPIQMISCTDTNGKITPIRFRFRDRNGELITINIEKSFQQTSSIVHSAPILSAPHRYTERRKHSG